MGGSTVSKDVGTSIDPHVRVAHLLGSWHHKRLVLFSLVWHNVKESVSTLVFLKLHDTLGLDSRGVDHSRKLGSQELLLLAEEKGVSEDLSFEITSEEDFGLTGHDQVFVGKIWKPFPICERVVRYIVGQFIDTCATSFELGVRLTFFAFTTAFGWSFFIFSSFTLGF